jgi:GMP synthase (glutamine-hydrolysing)
LRKLLVFQHVPFEPLGIVDAMFKAAGFRIRYVNFNRAEDAHVAVDRYHGLVVLGGPMSADEVERHPHLKFEQAAIRVAVERGMPTLGICLGAQLMAASFGGRILRRGAVEFGWRRVTPTAAGVADPVIGHLGTGADIFQWHSDTFTLPAAAEHLAASAECRYQAFRIGECAYGFQFHLEADRALIRRWVDAKRHVAELERRGVVIERERIERETAANVVGAHRLADRVFGEFIGRFYRWSRRRALPSR